MDAQLGQASVSFPPVRAHWLWVAESSSRALADPAMTDAAIAESMSRRTSMSFQTPSGTTSYSTRAPRGR